MMHELSGEAEPKVFFRVKIFLKGVGEPIDLMGLEKFSVERNAVSGNITSVKWKFEDNDERQILYFDISQISFVLSQPYYLKDGSIEWL